MLVGIGATTLMIVSVIIIAPQKAFASVLFEQPYKDVQASSATGGGFTYVVGQRVLNNSGSAINIKSIVVDEPSACTNLSLSITTGSNSSDNAGTFDGDGNCIYTFTSGITVANGDYIKFFWNYGGGTGNSIFPYGRAVGDNNYGKFLVADYDTFSSGGTLGISDMFYRICDTVTCSSDIYNTTRILDMQPQNGSTTSNIVNFSFSAYISPEDAERGAGVQVKLHNIDQNLLFFDSPDDIVLYDSAVTTGGVFNYATSTYLNDGGYRLEAKLSGTSEGFLFIPGISGCDSLVGPLIDVVCVKTSVQFVVNQQTFLSNINQASYASANSIFASTSATSTAVLASTCNPFGGDFDTLSCLAFVFIPDTGLLKSSLNNFKDNISTHFPLGYITDFYNIISTTTEGTLTVFSAHLPTGLGLGSGRFIELDLAHSLDWILYSTSTIFQSEETDNTKNFYQITSYYWDLILYFLLGIYIVSRVLGSRLWSIDMGNNQTLGGSDLPFDERDRYNSGMYKDFWNKK